MARVMLMLPVYNQQRLLTILGNVISLIFVFAQLHRRSVKYDRGLGNLGDIDSHVKLVGTWKSHDKLLVWSNFTRQMDWFLYGGEPYG